MFLLGELHSVVVGDVMAGLDAVDLAGEGFGQFGVLSCVRQAEALIDGTFCVLLVPS